MRCYVRRNVHTYVLPLPIFFFHEHSKSAKFQKQSFSYHLHEINEKLFLFISRSETCTIVKMEGKWKFLLKLWIVCERKKNQSLLYFLGIDVWQFYILWILKYINISINETLSAKYVCTTYLSNLRYLDRNKDDL